MKGILFTPENIKATIENRKTQTRRLMQIQPTNGDDSYVEMCNHPEFGIGATWPGESEFDAYFVKPRYLPGETVYIKEVHCYLLGDGENNDFGIAYIGEHSKAFPEEIRWWRDNGGMMDYPIDTKLRSPMFLKEMFARYFIQIEDVRPERIQQITFEDCMAEGITYILPATPKDAYHQMWDSINKPPFGWASNPWVWVYQYKLSSPAWLRK